MPHVSGVSRVAPDQNNLLCNRGSGPRSNVLVASNCAALSQEILTSCAGTDAARTWQRSVRASQDALSHSQTSYVITFQLAKPAARQSGRITTTQYVDIGNYEPALSSFNRERT